MFYVFTLLLVFFCAPISILANDNESAIQQENEDISRQIDQALGEINISYANLEALKQDIADKEFNIEETQKQINATKQSIENRKNMVGNRLQSLQTTQNDAGTIGILMNAESISDFMNRAYAISVLQTAERNKMNDLNADKEKLQNLKFNLESEKKELAETQMNLETKQIMLEQEVSALKQKLSENQAVLDRIAKEREEEIRIAKEKAAEEARKIEEQNKKAELEAAKRLEEQNKKAEIEVASQLKPVENTVVEAPKPTPEAEASKDQSTSNTETPVEEEKKEEPSTSVEPTVSGGRTLQMQSTAYSYTEPGMSTLTATGVDLRQNSRVVAVDPNVIPLNSLVEVSGYGYALAADTGGAIKGNIIDVHFNSVAECINWGRRTVTVTVK